MERFRIRVPDDLHRHPRRQSMLNLATKYIGPFARITGMGNTKPVIADGPDVTAWQSEINQALLESRQKCQVFIAAKALETTTPEVIDRLYEAGAKALKVFFKGSGTTHADEGIPINEIHIIWPALERIQSINRKSSRKMLVLWHCENPNAEDGLSQERECIHIFDMAVRLFPGIHHVFEHMSTKEGVKYMEQVAPDNAAATITPQHLRITHDHITRWGLQAHNYCRPEAQFAADKRALVKAATSGNPKFFFGSDDAPHLWTTKVPADPCTKGMPGVFTGPYTLGHYTQVFEEAGALEKLENFASRFGAEFYQEPLNEGKIELIRDPFQIAKDLDGMVPFMPGETLNWRWQLA